MYYFPGMATYVGQQIVGAEAFEANKGKFCSVDFKNSVYFIKFNFPMLCIFLNICTYAIGYHYTF